MGWDLSQIIVRFHQSKARRVADKMPEPVAMPSPERDKNAIAGFRNLSQFGENFGVPQIPTPIEISAGLSATVPQGQQRIIKIVMIGIDPLGSILLPEHFANRVRFLIGFYLADDRAHLRIESVQHLSLAMRLRVCLYLI